MADSSAEVRVWDAAIVGGGISGLSSLYFLRKARPDGDFILLEALGRLGGKILTDRRDGFILEAGPDSFLSRKPGVMEFISELGLEAALQPARGGGGSYISMGQKLYPLPEGFSGLVPGDPDLLDRMAFLSPGGAERAKKEPSVPPRTDGAEESIGDFFTRRFGREAFERLFEPLLGGIYSGDAERISLQAAFPQLAAMEASGKGLMGTRPGLPQGPKGPAFHSLTGGMDLLVKALEKAVLALPGSGRLLIRSGCKVSSVSREGQGFLLSTGCGEFEARQLISALGPGEAAELFDSVETRGSAGFSPSDLAAALRAIPVTSTANLSIGFGPGALADLPPGKGYIVPKIAGGRFNACTWSSRKWEGRTPPEHSLVRFHFGGARNPQGWNWPRDEMVDLALEQLRPFNGGTRPEPRVIRLFRWKSALPQPETGHSRKLGAIFSSAPRGLHFAGNWIQGVGIPDCIARAREVVGELLENYSIFTGPSGSREPSSSLPASGTLFPGSTA